MDWNSLVHLSKYAIIISDKVLMQKISIIILKQKNKSFPLFSNISEVIELLSNDLINVKKTMKRLRKSYIYPGLKK